jgi:hypothetical protein
MRFTEKIIFIIAASLILLTGCLNKSSQTDIPDLKTENPEIHIRRVEHLVVDPEYAGSISGQVANLMFSKTESNVSVYAHNGTASTDYVLTDLDGRFTLPVPAEDTYSVYFYKSGFLPGTYETVYVSLNEEEDLGIIGLEASPDEQYISIQGKVYSDTSETPLSGATVFVLDQNYNITTCMSDISDSEGNYCIDFVSFNSYRLYITKGQSISEGLLISVTPASCYMGQIYNVSPIIIQNSAPYITDTTQISDIVLPMDMENPLKLTVTAQDPDNDILTYSWSFSGGYMDISDNNENYWITEEEGTYYITVRVTDYKDEYIEYTWTVNAYYPNHPPEITSYSQNPGILTISQDTPEVTYTFEITASDQDSDELDYIWNISGGTITDSQETSIQWTTSETGSYSVTITVDDNNGEQTSYSWYFTVTEDQGQTPLSFTWNTIPSNNGWAGRYSFQSFVRNNKIYVLTGRETWGPEAAIVSIDSTGTWNDENTETGNSFYHYDLIDFGDDFIMIGGYYDIPLAEVWYSTNGLNWSIVRWTPDANSFGARYAFQAFEGENYVYILGGKDNTNYKNDLYRTEDGYNWYPCTLNSNGDTFPERGYFQIVEFNNKMWLIGGRNSSDFLGDIWYTEDGESWHKVTDNAFGTLGGRSNFSTAVYQNKLYVIGGLTDSGATNQIWYTENGIDWEQADSGSFQARYNHSSEVMDGKIWIIGGQTSSGTFDTTSMTAIIQE